MILYHGTDQKFEAFDEAYFASRPTGHANGALGVWASLTPCLPMGFGADVLVLKLKSACLLELDYMVVRQMSDDDAYAEDITTFYRDSAQEWKGAGYDVAVVKEMDETLGNFIILDPENIEIIERVSSSDIDRLRELEDEHWNEPFMQRASKFVRTVAREFPAARFAMG
jgi:hypothetical protein